MRYRNRIKLAPGVNVNLSLSGISTTLGPKGMNVNLGKNGAYLNTGIPGTGLYDRTKISSTKSEVQQDLRNGKTQVGVQLDLNEKYEPVLNIFDQAGRDITTTQTIAKIKRTPEYKENLKKSYELYYNLLLEETQNFTDLYKNTLKPVSPEEIRVKLKHLIPGKYSPAEFDRYKPYEEIIRVALEREAADTIRNILFWKNKKERKAYVETHLQSRLKSAIEEWEKEKLIFEEKELQKEKLENEQLIEIYETERSILEADLRAEENYVLAKFEAILNEIKIEPEFHLDFEYNEVEKTFRIDLDLPEIEDIPKEFGTILSSGKLSVKAKSDKHLREDYAKCVCGLAFLIGGIAFMAASGIEKVEISGYTQRVDKVDGLTKDDYIYMIVFDHETFGKLNYKKLDPVLAFQNFKHKIELSKTFIFKTINPDMN